MTEGAAGRLRRRRLLLFSAGFEERGGAARRSRLIASSLASRGWDVRVISKAGDHSSFSFRRAPNLMVLEVPRLRWRVGGALLYLAVAVPLGLLWGARATMLLAVQLVSPTTAAGLCSLAVRRPYMALSTSSGEFSESAYVMSSRVSWLRRALLRRAAYLGAQTEVVAEELTQLVPPDRIAIVNNPVVISDPIPLTGAPRALYTGRLSGEKDLVRLLEAWRVVAGRRPAAQLTLAGDGGHYRSVEQELRSMAAADPVLAATVRFTGWVSDVAPLLASCDVYVTPSLTEGMSNALLEACAAGRVVVASDIAPNRALLGDDHPLLFRTGDTHALVSALEQALDDPAVRMDAVRHVLARIEPFSVDAVAGHLEELFEAAAKTSARGATAPGPRRGRP